MYLIILVSLVLFPYILYVNQSMKRITRLEIGDLTIDETKCILDLRDFNVSYKRMITDSYNIPFAYFKRYYKELPAKELIVVTAAPSLTRVEYCQLKRKGWGVRMNITERALDYLQKKSKNSIRIFVAGFG